MKLKWLINTTAIALLIFVAFLGLARHDSVLAAQEEGSKIESTLLDSFAADGNADFIVRFTEQADLSPAYSMDWDARGEFVYNSLRDTAANSQVNAKSILDIAGLKYQTFISGNELYVWGGTLTAANELAALPEVYFIRATRTYYIDPVAEVKPFENIAWAGDLLSTRTLTTVGSSPDALAWGIVDTGADQFWTNFSVQGDGMVVANIDTGVQWNHPALDQAFKCGADPTNPACWSDPSNICGGSACDNNGHGTHTMGTMVGDDDPVLTWQAGMAPNAQWIACKGCETNSCSDFALNSCADWIVAPNGDPANRPDVVNNSWGGGGGDAWYLAKVQAWVAAGIFPAFSAGNAGPGCSTLGSPGDYQESFGSAAHDVSRNIAGFSSRGPSAFGHDPYTKPNISAPGVSVCSSVPTNAWSCGYSGTSMASPHTAGAVALLWSCNPALVGQIDATFQILQNNTDVAPAGTCGAPPDGQGNYTFGYGYLNVNSAGVGTCGGVALGTLEGHVYDTGGLPIEGASVTAAPAVEGNQIQAITDPNGFYSMNLVVGTYNVTASKTGYTSQTVNGIVIEEGITDVQDFTLEFLGQWTAGPAMCFDLYRLDGEYYPGTGLVYFLGGRADATITDGNIYSFDPTTEECLDTGEDMPNPVSNYTANLVNDGTIDVLCTFGGRQADGTQTLNIQCYNPNTNTAAVVADLPGAWAGYVPGAQVVVDNMVYIFGGFNPTVGVTARTEKYDPVTHSFTQLGDLSMARSYIMATAVDGIIYAFGGDTWDGAALIAQTRSEKMDPLVGTWDDTGVADLIPQAGDEGQAFGFDSSAPYELANQIVIATLSQWSSNSNLVVLYDVATNSYNVDFPDLLNARRNHAGVFVPVDTVDPTDGLPGMWVFGGWATGDAPPFAPAEFFPLAITTLAPVIAVDPTELDAELLPDATTSITLTISNEGNADLTWELYDGIPDPTWSDNFDSYPVDFQLHGQGGWKGWDNSPAAGALTSDDFALSVPNSVAILGASDLTHPYAGYTSGTWTYTAWQYIPTDFAGTTYFILLNTYNDGGPYNWSTEVSFDSASGLITNDGPVGGTLPMVKGQWVEIRVEIDLDSDTQSFFYDNDLLFTDSWTDGMSGGGVLDIANVDLFANGASVVYYDDISLTPTSDPACAIYGDIPWLSTVPINGTTLPGESSPVDVMFDATGLPVGLYNAELCAASNDPTTPVLPIPVTMTVLPQADLAITKTDTPDPVRFGEVLTYTLLVSNAGPQDATGVVVVDTLPAGVTFVSASVGCTELAGDVTCDVGDMANGGFAEITIVVIAPDVEGTLTNTATVEGNEVDPDLTDNTATQDTTVIPAIVNIYLPLVMR